ncbi:pyridoxal phosphate-dependent aminotransferase, partial [bacterium]|nr:pyridoxal phosphate-dependent aminotransferase [bacterium]
MKDQTFPTAAVKKLMLESGLKEIGLASIRELRKLVAGIEAATGEKFIRMEMGIPGLPAPRIGIEAEIAALKSGVASYYPDIEGIPELRAQAARFVKSFLNIPARPDNCFAAVGSMHACFSALMVAGRMDRGRDTVLFIDPGFPVHKQLVKMIGLKADGFDVCRFRGNKLKNKLEEHLEKGNISSILYSNPNNPSWICFTEEELKTIGELATKYGVLVMEDLAYFAMDFRQDLGKPGVPPFQPTVARYTDQYILFISSSKAFSYAGQRIGILFIPDGVFRLEKKDLLAFYPSANFGHAIVFGTLYATTAGATHSAQAGLAALFKAASDGSYDFIGTVREYGERAKVMKRLFLEHEFHLVYDRDADQALADGFYFTVGYPGMSGKRLVEELLCHGISAIALETTGSREPGIRACVSFVLPEQFPALAARLA